MSFEVGTKLQKLLRVFSHDSRESWIRHPYEADAIGPWRTG